MARAHIWTRTCTPTPTDKAPTHALHILTEKPGGKDAGGGDGTRGLGRIPASPWLLLLLLLLYVPPGQAQAIPCDALLGMDETMLVLDGFAVGTNHSSAGTAYPINYLYQSTKCRGCDLLPLTTVVGSVCVSSVCVKVSIK
jgi:hypothetical protein